MAINWRAGLDEIQQGGSILSQGIGALAQQEQQRGQVMSGIARERRQIEEQNAATKRQENQQIFDSAIGAANTFANVMNQQRQFERQKQQDAVEQEKIGWEREDRKLKNMIQAGAEEAIIKANKPGLTRNDGETNSQFAARIDAAQKLQDAEDSKKTAKEKFDLEKKTAESNIAHQRVVEDNDKTRLGLEKRKTELAELEASQNAERLARTDAEKRIENLKSAVLNASDPNVHYNSMPEETRKTQSKGLEKAASSITAGNASGEALHEFMQMFNKRPGADGKYSLADIRAAAQEASKLDANDHRIAQLEMLSGKLWLAARQSMKGQGSLSDQESETAAKAFGSNKLASLDTFSQLTTEAERGVFSKIRNVFIKEITGEAGVIALTKELDKKETDARKSVMNEFTTNDGFYAIQPKARADVLYQALPKQMREQMQYQDFVKLSTQEQASLAFGKDNAAKINWNTVATHDDLARNPYKVVEDLAKQEGKTTFNRPGLKAEARQQIEQEYRDNVARITNPYLQPTADGPGVKKEAAGVGTPPRTTGDGNAIPSVDATNTILNFINPITADRVRAIASMRGAPAAPGAKVTVPTVKMGSFVGGK